MQSKAYSGSLLSQAPLSLLPTVECCMHLRLPVLHTAPAHIAVCMNSSTLDPMASLIQFFLQVIFLGR